MKRIIYITLRSRQFVTMTLYSDPAVSRVLGVTPSISIYRGEEIDRWLSKHIGITNYVIIDDMDCRQFRKEHHSHLVTTNHFSGLDSSSAQEAIRLLI